MLGTKVIEMERVYCFAVVVWAHYVYVSRTIRANKGKNATMACMRGQGTIVHGGMLCSNRIDGESYILETAAPA